MAMVNVRSIAAYRRTQRSSLQLGLRVGGQLVADRLSPRGTKVNSRIWLAP